MASVHSSRRGPPCQVLIMRLARASALASDAHSAFVEVASSVNAMAALLLKALISLHSGQFSQASRTLAESDGLSAWHWSRPLCSPP